MSNDAQRSVSGRHNNMHFRPVSSYLIELTEFEVTCVARFTMAASVHIVPSGFAQRGCIAHVPSPLRIANALPWLPQEIDVLVVHQTPRNTQNASIRKMYGVCRKHLETALQGLMYGVPKGGYETPPLDGEAYEQYLYRDHEDGTRLKGRFFGVSNLPNPAYWNVQSLASRLSAYTESGDVPPGVIHRIHGSIRARASQ